ncbi:MAG: kelch repeat-containing protein, partial [Acidobacteriota bacterium]
MAIAEPNETRYARRRPAARTLDVILPLLLGAPLASVASEWVPGAQAPPVSIPSYYGGTAAAYDSSRGRIVVFGDVSNGTWEHDGSGWKRSPAVTPSDLGFREGHAMAYDPARRRVVLYGGSYSLDPTIYLKTWEWDGVAWCEGFTGPPGDRKGHGMAFHQALGRIVLYGGNGADRSTWEYGPTGWQAGATAPAAMAGRGSFAMAYDPQRQLVVIHGGRDDTGQVRGDTWEYGTGGWVAGPSSGPTKSHHAMAYVPGRLVVFGGTGSVDDTWEYDGTSWTQMPAAPAAMSGRADHVMVSLPGRIVLFGGVYLTMQPLEDTWQYDGAWTDVGQPPAGFLVNSGAAAAYDSARDRLVLYGGQGFVASASNQTWEYDGAAWQPGPASPPALGWRIYHSMGFDARRGRVMLFGGDAQGSTTNSDTWEYDGTSWSPAAPPPPGLAPRQLAAMAYDTARQRMVMFGGSESGGGLGDDTWEHDGAGWTQGPTAPAAMGGRVGTQMDYDPTLARCVLYGGIGTVPNERHTWLYDGSSWDQGPLADPGMGDIIWGCMAFSPRLGRSVLALGHDNGNGPTTATWEFDGAAWTPGRAGPSDWV